MKNPALANDMKKRFSSKEFLAGISRQAILAGETTRAAKEIARIAREIVVKPGTTIIKQGEYKHDVFFVLQGSVKVFVNSSLVAIRTAGQHVGEMAGIMNSRRTATVISAEESILAKVSKLNFLKIADKLPFIWANLTRELAMRLDQRRNLIREPNPFPNIFIGSSTKHKAVAEKIREGLDGLNAQIDVWSDPGVFAASDTFIETLTAAAAKADFAVLVFAKDDVLVQKGKKSFVTRDNVVFEAGLFIGAISRKRTFLVRPKNARIKILTDLAGVTLLDFHKVKDRIDVANACYQIRKVVLERGVR